MSSNKSGDIRKADRPKRLSFKSNKTSEQLLQQQPPATVVRKNPLRLRQQAITCRGTGKVLGLVITPSSPSPSSLSSPQNSPTFRFPDKSLTTSLVAEGNNNRVTKPISPNLSSSLAKFQHSKHQTLPRIYTSTTEGNNLNIKMLKKISCVSCSSCCKVTNDEQTNGVKILRKRDTPASSIDLNSELETLSTTSVIQRLKAIVEKLEKGELDQISPEVLQKNIQYALKLIQDGEAGKDRNSTVPLNSVTEKQQSSEDTDNESENSETDQFDTQTGGEKRRQDEPDNELSEVDEEVKPEEVRKWLASTFTKNAPAKQRTEPRPRFRSVANAIRVGLFVDRFYRQLSATSLQIPPDIQIELKEINGWQFDIYFVFMRSLILTDKLENFLTAVEFGYTKLKNPYHNDLHAADVTQTLHFFINSSSIASVLTDLEIYALIFAAVIHDFEHTGRTNNFHVNVGTELALLYNDRSVLENHHVSAAFRLMKDDDKNILANLKPEEYRDFRNLVVEMVLSTDMSTHFAQVKHVKSILSGERNAQMTMSMMNLLLHAADISHPGKPWKIHRRFADAILEEFFLQGDEELRLGLPYSPLCDRNTVLIPESQISFIEFIVEPSLSILSDLVELVVKESNSGSSGGGAITSGSTSQNAISSGAPKSKSTSSASNVVATTRRTESDKCLKSDSSTSGTNSKVLSSRTPSFPLQHGKTHGPIRPWNNHFVENTSKWRMISAESCAAGNSNPRGSIGGGTASIPTTLSSSSETPSSVPAILPSTEASSPNRNPSTGPSN